MKNEHVQKIEFFHECNPPTSTAQQRQFFKSGCTALKPGARLARAVWQAIVEQHNPSIPFTGPIPVTIVLSWTRKGQVMSEPKTTKPDVDNLAKLILDAMTKSRYWKDDNQVAELSISKHWSEIPGVYVLAKEMKFQQRR